MYAYLKTMLECTSVFCACWCVCVCARARTRALWHLRYGTFAPYLPTNPATRPAHKPAPFSEEDTRTPPLCRTQTHRLCTRHHHCPPGRLRRRCRCEPRVGRCDCEHRPQHMTGWRSNYEVTHIRGSIRSSVSVSSWVPCMCVCAHSWRTALNKHSPRTLPTRRENVGTSRARDRRTLQD